MKRFAESYLNDWKVRVNRKPLLIRGARQVGKTYLVESWGGLHFENVVTVNLELEKDFHLLFELESPEKIVEAISLVKDVQISSGKTLLFIDEIQAFPKAIQTLRYFFEKLPNLHIIVAGSLIEFTLSSLEYSMPVGRIEFLYMYPLTFYEFLEAMGRAELLEFINKINLDTSVLPAIHNKLMELLNIYLLIGGMPEVVHAYTNGSDLLDVQRIQSSLIQTFISDFSKYGKRVNISLLDTIFNYVGKNTGKKIKYVNISRQHRANEIKQNIDLLLLSQVAIKVSHSSCNGMPLGAEVNEKVFKLIFLDTGLISRLCGLNLIAVQKFDTINKGALAEQFIGQELSATGLSFEKSKLYYWARESKNSNAEVDYVVSKEQKIVPIEVKSGKTGRLRSILQFIKDKDSNYAIRFYSGEISVLRDKTVNKFGEKKEYTLVSLPAYLVGRIQDFI